MITYRDLFFHYLESDAYDEQIEKTLKEKTLERDFSFDNELELIFLYRQARIFNIESELEISSNSPNYLRKRKKVLRFFAFLDIADSDGLHLFSYSEENKTINMRGFLLLCSWYSFNTNDSEASDATFSHCFGNFVYNRAEAEKENKEEGNSDDEKKKSPRNSKNSS